MPWGARNKQGVLSPVGRPKHVQVSQSAIRANPDLQKMQEAIDTARAQELPGDATELMGTISVETYRPPQDAIDEALGTINGQ